MREAADNLGVFWMRPVLGEGVSRRALEASTEAEDDAFVRETNSRHVCGSL
jgi:hypothetical protein